MDKWSSVSTMLVRRVACHPAGEKTKPVKGWMSSEPTTSMLLVLLSKKGTIWQTQPVVSPAVSLVLLLHPDNSGQNTESEAQGNSPSLSSNSHASQSITPPFFWCSWSSLMTMDEWKANNTIETQRNYLSKGKQLLSSENNGCKINHSQSPSW